MQRSSLPTTRWTGFTNTRKRDSERRLIGRVASSPTYSAICTKQQPVLSRKEEPRPDVDSRDSLSSDWKQSLVTLVPNSGGFTDTLHCVSLQTRGKAN